MLIFLFVLTTALAAQPSTTVGKGETALYLTTNVVRISLPLADPVSFEYRQVETDLSVRLIADRQSMTGDTAPRPAGFFTSLTKHGPSVVREGGQSYFDHVQTGYWLSPDPTSDALRIDRLSFTLKRANGLAFGILMLDPTVLSKFSGGSDPRAYVIASHVHDRIAALVAANKLDLTKVGATLTFTGTRSASDGPGQSDELVLELAGHDLRRLITPRRGQRFAEFKRSCARALGFGTRGS